MRVAVAQFPITADISANRRFIIELIGQAKDQAADLILFPEVALSGYVELDFPTFEDLDWSALNGAMSDVFSTVAEAGIWTIVGAAHRLDTHAPHNSLYVIDPTGNVVDRYDKRICATIDLRHFQPGGRPVVVEIEGRRCGLLICHEWRYPELYREYKRLGCDIILQAWYDGGYSEKDMRREASVFRDVIPSTAVGHAAVNHFWLCGANNSRPQSCFGSFIVQPNGVVITRQDIHVTGVAVATLGENSSFPDLASHARPQVMAPGAQYGVETEDPRSSDVTCW